MLVLHCELGFGCLLMFCFWVVVYLSLLVGFGLKSGGLEEFTVTFSLFDGVVASIWFNTHLKVLDSDF